VLSRYKVFIPTEHALYVGIPEDIKGTGKVVPVLNYAPRHEGVLWEWRYGSTHSLTSALDGGEWSASRPGRLTPRERALGTHWIGGWVGPRAVLDAMVKRKIPSPAGKRTLDINIINNYVGPSITNLIDVLKILEYILT
jgi:hypothetical protein